MMRIIIVVLSFIIVGLFAVLWKYQRQIKDICRQLHFLKEHDSNMRIMTDIRWGNLSELCKELNEILQQQKLERRAYMRKEREISETYTNLSHDIRTPLTSLDGYFQLLEKSANESDKSRYLSIIQERIESLKNMLEELFTYTKLQNEEYEVKLEKVNLNQILKDTIFSYYDYWMECKMEPQFDISEESIWVRGNTQALQRVIRNVIKNGLDHGEKEMRISLHKENHQAVLCIQNKMQGTQKIDVDRLFERFYKADPSRNKNSTGLGLSIAKGFVQKMGGKITAAVNGSWFPIAIELEIIF